MQLVSIIVPVYNIENYIAQCVQSVLAQTYTNLELILVDDGATDSSGRICDEFAAQDHRIRVFHTKNGGVSTARNFGFSKASAELIMFVDGDDIIHSRMLEHLVAALQGIEESSIAICGKSSFKYTFDSNREFEDSVPEVLNGTSALTELLYQRIINAPFAKLIKKSLLDGVSFPEGVRVGEDLLANILLFKKLPTLVVLQQELYGYRVRPGSAMQTSNFNDRSALIFELEKEQKIGRQSATVARAYSCRIFAEAIFAMVTPIYKSPIHKSKTRREEKKRLIEKINFYRHTVLTDSQAPLMYRAFALASYISPSIPKHVINIRTKNFSQVR